MLEYVTSQALTRGYVSVSQVLNWLLSKAPVTNETHALNFDIHVM